MKRYIKASSREVHPNIQRLCDVLNQLVENTCGSASNIWFSIYNYGDGQDRWSNVSADLSNGRGWDILTPELYDEILQMTDDEIIKFAENEYFNSIHSRQYEQNARVCMLGNRKPFQSSGRILPTAYF